MADKKDHIKGYGTPKMQGKRGDTLVDLNLSDEEIAEGDCVHFTIEDDSHAHYKIVKDKAIDKSEHSQLDNTGDSNTFRLEMIGGDFPVLTFSKLSNKLREIKELPITINFLKIASQIKESDGLDKIILDYEDVTLVECISGKSELGYTNLGDAVDLDEYLSNTVDAINHMINRYSKNTNIGCVLALVLNAIDISHSSFSMKKLFYYDLITQILDKATYAELNIVDSTSGVFKFIDKELHHLVRYQDISNKYLKKLDKDDTTANDLDTLVEQKDDPQRGRVGRDFNSVQWVKKPKKKAEKFTKKKQEQFSIRTFQQVYDAIDQAIEESGEKKNEWIVRAIMDRLQTDHPDIFQSLKDKKDEFPDIRSDARTGIDFIYE